MYCGCEALSLHFFQLTFFLADFFQTQDFGNTGRHVEGWGAKGELHPVPTFMSLCPGLAFCWKWPGASLPLQATRKMEFLLDKRENMENWNRCARSPLNFHVLLQCLLWNKVGIDALLHLYMWHKENNSFPAAPLPLHSASATEKETL